MIFECIKAYETTSTIVEVGSICFLLYNDFDLYITYKGEAIPISEDYLDECFRRVYEK